MYVGGAFFQRLNITFAYMAADHAHRLRPAVGMGDLVNVMVKFICGKKYIDCIPSRWIYGRCVWLLKYTRATFANHELHLYPLLARLAVFASLPCADNQVGFSLSPEQPEYYSLLYMYRTTMELRSHCFYDPPNFPRAFHLETRLSTFVNSVSLGACSFASL